MLPADAPDEADGLTAAEQVARIGPAYRGTSVQLWTIESSSTGASEGADK